MSLTITRKLALVTLGILGIAFLLFIIFSFTNVAGQDFSLRQEKILSSQTPEYFPERSLETSRANPSFPHVTSGLPIHLSIEKINIDAVLEFVGLTEEDAVDIPKGPINPAWFELGPRPGEIGNAIIVGHYGWKDNTPAVFDHLNKLSTGDKISVRDDQGVTHTFVVREIRTYAQNAVAQEVFISGDGKAHLNLITCGGVWDKAKKSYADRLVVFTDKIELK